jgi:AraC-like DNA-binding protein
MTLRFAGLSDDYPTGFRIEPHWHDAHQIVHAQTGVMRITTLEGNWVLPPGRALWVPAACVHEIYCHGAVSMRTVYLLPSDGSDSLNRPVWAAGAEPEKRDKPGGGWTEAYHSTITLPGNCVVWQVSSLMREIIMRMASGRDPRQDGHLAALLLSEIATIDALPLHLPDPSDPRVRRVTMALSENPADQRSLENWAVALGMSPRTLIRRFQSETGMTFRQWRRQARLLAALERLAAGGPVTSVAYDVGYDGLSAFVEAFRQAFGVTPGRYFRDQ